MTRRTAFLLVAVALPPVILAAVGITHPVYLTDATALYWRNLHIAMLPVFPLLGFAPWLLVRRSFAPVSGSIDSGSIEQVPGSAAQFPGAVAQSGGRLLAWIVGVLGFVYAAFYTALDVLAGIGAGGLKLDGMGMAVGTLYNLADVLGMIGSVALVVACVIATVVVAVRSGIFALVGGGLAVIGSVLFLRDHIYLPGGVAGQLFLAVGWSVVVYSTVRATRRMPRRPRPQTPSPQTPRP